MNLTDPPAPPHGQGVQECSVLCYQICHREQSIHPWEIELNESWGIHPTQSHTDLKNNKKASRGSLYVDMETAPEATIQSKKQSAEQSR